ncbi:MAG: peptidoglycan DD-metalloendopeptidase family protein [Psychromonas sp.]|nr:peptidoglycan DD-metalloendopeptidase family protein [Alteromonadales bacterium]MCP5079258.1 peptidoglycan DD-metalloendopeptidase family protein [Psychromonas sp.]
MIRLLLLFVCVVNLVACSSFGGRAPVNDITLRKSSRAVTDVVYSTKSTLKGKKTYTVVKGDTLYAISWRSGVDINLLVKRNRLKPPYVIKEGQVLQLQGYAENRSDKSDLSSQNVIKKSNTTCTGQNCNKNKQEKVAQEKTKAYSSNKIDKKTTAKPKKNKIITNKKMGSWSWPVKGDLTKRFSTSQSTMQGISIVNTRGSSITAAAPGKVVYAGSGLRGYGNLIIIKHNHDYLSAYAHNEKLLVGENEQINMGQKIAVMGDSGSDHVHLHFEIRYRGKSVDPLRYLPKR